MNLAVDVERWFTLPETLDVPHSPLLPAPSEAANAVKVLGHAILAAVPETSGQQTFLLQQLRLVFGSVLNTYYQRQRKVTDISHFPLLPVLPTDGAAAAVVTAGNNLLRVLTRIGVYRDNNYAMELLLAILTMSQLILSSGISDNT